MTLPERIASKIDASGICWEWTASCHPDGYGQVVWQGCPRISHRVVWEILVGPIPEGLHVDHLCLNKSCVNPDHLELVDPAENTRRALLGRTSPACQSGHSGSERYPLASGQCRTCRRSYAADWARRSRIAKKKETTS